MERQNSEEDTRAIIYEDTLIEENVPHFKKELRNDLEVQQLARAIDVNEQAALLSYGKQPTEEISRFSDQILANMQTTKIEDTGELLKQLGVIMDRFDKKDFEEQKGFFSKVFGRRNKLIDKLFGKYQTLGHEIDIVYREISQYEKDMLAATNMLDEMYDQNYDYYMALEKHIVAGELKLQTLKEMELPSLEEKARVGDQTAVMALDTLRNNCELLEQRLYDLEMAKMVALQTAPQIRLLQRGNTKLIAKINAAFVTTIPVFKNGIIQAVAAKRQQLVAESLSELDRRTNEMLLKNAQNISDQSRQIAEMANQPSVKIETIEKTWEIIVQGLEETKAIEEDNRRKRAEGTKRLDQLQSQLRQLQ